MVCSNTDNNDKPRRMSKWEKAIAKQNANWLKRPSDWRQTSVHHAWNCDGAVTKRITEQRLKRMEE